MHIAVDMTTCQSYAQCAFLAPDVFRFEGDEALVYDPDPPDEFRSRIEQSAAACPVQAIRLTGEQRRPLRQMSTPSALTETDHVVVVGASLAGLTAAETLRSEGFTGPLTVIGDERDEPYDRPPLSKQVLLGTASAAGTRLPRASGLDIQWRLGVGATGLDVSARQVVLADGERVPYDRVLIATGTRARPWPVAHEAAMDGVHTLRTADDAARLRARLAAGPRRVLVIGGGFTGSEIASACRRLDIPVTLVDRGSAPLARALGDTVAHVLADVQREHGVDLRSHVTVSSLQSDAKGAVTGAVLSDGTELSVDVVVVAIGALRNAEWLSGSGLSVGPLGVDCDASCRALASDGSIVDGVFVAGDVAAFPHPSGDGRRISVEHWGNAVGQATIAAGNMRTDGQARHEEIPVFWSNQFGHVIKSVGTPETADSVVIAQGSLGQRAFVAVYGIGDRMVGATALDHVKWLEHYRRQIGDGAAFPPTGRTIDTPSGDDRGVRPHSRSVRPDTVSSNSDERTK
ncbi:FAD-dependent oxidoreductase [Rathayibacter tanaceti]|uniref:FAD-dependent oxidoreductase n=2 Tax=Rathayibacter tanaceti TaxID=1671680 RepID=A0A162GIC5_9MICO|nr:FAD-dependent oxidoreductase [Rathayibacter tanaceti]KZX21659.1 Putidaredoxin reductase [Rathayibacter tanaceti]QHC54822.1 FAD-dependent oxidoreductase [Rathayibacter tanaceti]TCO37353.1 NADPH-dependent 2,4-dienoyl-CoA reductase/sulfur reductase-like enzyme [Rathayibacter tanaceti]